MHRRRASLLLSGLLGAFSLALMCWQSFVRANEVPLFEGGKIWIQWNSMEDDVAADLVERGIPKSDLVLELYPPSLRKFIEPI